VKVHSHHEILLLHPLLFTESDHHVTFIRTVSSDDQSVPSSLRACQIDRLADVELQLIFHLLTAGERLKVRE
jgi:hypothetical protein